MSDSNEAVQPTPPTPEELLAAAERYAKAGLKIYPVYIPGLKPDGKKDVRVPIRSWYDATDDLAQVREWWGERFRGAGIGVDMGASRLAVADGDTHDGGVIRLLEWLDYQGHPSQTASGGVHVWFRDSGGTVGTGSNILGDKDHPSGVDARGVGGTIFMPPTHVPGYGTYSWGPEGEPDWSALPEVPAKLAAVCPPGGRKKDRLAAAPASIGASDSPFMTARQAIAAGGAGTFMHRDRVLTREAAMEQLRPLWDRVRDTKPPNGLWQAVADFARAAAHYQCWWSQTDVEGMVLAAYREGGHGYEYLDGGDLRAIAGGFRLQQEARDAGDLDAGWIAREASENASAMVEQVATATTGRLRRAMLKRSELDALPDPMPLMEHILFRNSVHVLAGKFGTYKSFVAISWAACLTTGRSWFGFQVPAPVPVIYAAAEGAPGLKRRLAAWEKAHGVQVPDNFYLIPVSARLNRPGDVQELEELIAETKAAAVVFDTFHASTPGIDENDNGEIGRVFDVLRGLSERHGVATVLPHHTGHSGERSRGGSSIEDDADVSFVIKIKGEDRGPESIRTMTHRKTKDEALLPDIELALALVEGTKSGHVVRADDEWHRAAREEKVEESGQVVRVPEPELWTKRYTRPDALLQQQILQALHSVGGTVGLTEAGTQRVMLERWYPEGLGRGAGKLRKDTYAEAWRKLLDATFGQDEPVVVSGTGGPKSMIINPLIDVTDE
jgi:AAA domain-containing protein/bifunctional DNA primase/polymerase-like protein